MKKHLQLFLTMLVIVTMLTLAVVPVVGYAMTAQANDEPTVESSYDTEWLKVDKLSYPSGNTELLVTVTPDIDALREDVSSFSKEQMAELVKPILSSAMDVVYDTVKSRLEGEQIEQYIAEYEKWLLGDETANVDPLILELANGQVKDYVDSVVAGIPTDPAELNDYEPTGAVEKLLVNYVKKAFEADPTIDLTSIEFSVEDLKSILDSASDDEIEAAKNEITANLNVSSLVDNIGAKEVALQFFAAIESISIGGEVLYDTADGNYVNLAAIKNLLLDLPKPYDVANMTNDEMQLSYDVSVNTKFADVDFTVTAKIGGGYDEIRAIARVISDHIDVKITDGVIDVDFYVPDEFAKVVLKAAKSGQFSDALKEKIFNAFNADGEDVHALVNNLSVEDLKTVVTSIDYKGLLDRDIIARYVDVSNLTDEQIFDLIDKYEGYFNIAKSYANAAIDKVVNVVPENLMDNDILSIFDYEDSNDAFDYSEGTFNYTGTHTLPTGEYFWKVVNELRARYPEYETYIDLALNYIDLDYVKDYTASVDVTVHVADIRKVEYRDVNDSFIKDGFLPVGADLDLFSGYTVENFFGWYDQYGKKHTVMPDYDVVLSALKTGEIEWAEDITVKYGEKAAVYVIIADDNAYEYVWKDANGNTVSTESSFILTDNSDSGAYHGYVYLNGEPVADHVVNVTILKDVIDVSDIALEETVFDINSDYTLELVNVPEHVEYEILYTKATELGIQSATVKLSVTDAANYELSDDEITLTWYAKQYVNLSAMTWDYTSEFTYDGQVKSVALNIPTELESAIADDYIVISYGEGASATDANTYVAYATVSTTDDTKYHIYGTLPTCTWKIAPESFNLSELTWGETEFVYSLGEEHRVEITNCPTFLEITYINDEIDGVVYSNYDTNAGSYLARAVCSVKNNNYTLVGDPILECEWKITPQLIAEPYVVGTYVYSAGVTHYADIQGDLTHVMADFTKESVESAINAGIYHIYFKPISSNYAWDENSDGDVTWVVCNYVEKIENEVDETCTADGSYDKVVYCTVCNEEISRETITVTAPGHTPKAEVEENRVGATCTTDGSYDTVVYCDVCGEELERVEHVITAPGHTPATEVEENRVGETCTVNGSYDTVVYCDVCGEELERVKHVIIAPGHSYVYSANGATITVTCTEGDFEEEITLSAPADLIYSGEKKTVSVSSNSFGLDNDDVIYSADPINVGTYTATVELDGATAILTFAIEQQQIDVNDLTVELKNNTVEYESEGTLELVITGDLAQYVDYTYNTVDTSYRGKRAVTFTLTSNDSNYALNHSVDFDCYVKEYIDLSNRTNFYWNLPKNAYGISEAFVYNNVEYSVTLNVPAIYAEILSVSCNGNKATDAGQYTATATVTVNDDYVDSYATKNSVRRQVWDIVPLNYSLDYAYENGLIKWTDKVVFGYDGAIHSVELVGSGIPEFLEFTYELDLANGITNSATDAGTYYAKVVSTSSSNYIIVGSVPVCEWTIQPANAIISGFVVLDNYPYADATSTFGEVEFYYSASENGPFTTTVPTAAGTYYVKAVVEGTSNYSGAEVGPLSFIIEEPIKIPDLGYDPEWLDIDVITAEGRPTEILLTVYPELGSFYEDVMSLDEETVSALATTVLAYVKEVVYENLKEKLNGDQLDQYADAYISWLLDDSAELPAEVEGIVEKVNKQIVTYVQTVVNHIDINNPDGAVEQIIADYVMAGGQLPENANVDIDTVKAILASVDDISAAKAEIVAELDLTEAISGLTANDVALQLIAAINSVSIGGNVIYDTTDGASLNLTAFKNLLLDLPRPYDVANMADDEMQLSYDIAVDTDFGDVALTVTGKVGGGYDSIRAIASIIADHIDVQVMADGTIDVDIYIPDEFAAIVLRAIESDQISDSLKKKVFAAFEADGNGIHALYNNLTVDDLIKLVQSVNFEGLLDKEIVKKYVDLSSYSEADIIAIIEKYENYFNIAKSYASIAVDFVVSRIPAEYMDDSFMSVLANGGNISYANGEFNLNGSCTLPTSEYFWKVINKISDRYPEYKTYVDLFVSLIDSDYIRDYTLSLDVNVSVPDIRRVDYYDANGKLIRSGFLPEGADLEFFGDYGATTFFGWFDSNGVKHTTMPGYDVELKAMIAGQVSWSEDKTIEYTDNYTLSATVEANRVTFEWYDYNGNLVSTSSSYDIPTNLTVGAYEYTGKVYVDGELYDTKVVTVTVTPKVIDVSGIQLNTTQVDFNNSYSITLENVPQHVIAEIIEGAVATELGKQIAKISVASADPNYAVSADSLERIWYAKFYVDLSTVEWIKINAVTTFALRSVSADLVYNGTEQGYVLDIDPALAEALGITYEGNTAIDVNEDGYVASAKVGNYDTDKYEVSNPDVPVTYNWSIAPMPVTIPGAGSGSVEDSPGWNYNSNFVFVPGETYTVEYVLPEGYEFIKVVYVIDLENNITNTATAAGKYVARVSGFTVIDSEKASNYAITFDIPADLTWTVCSFDTEVVAPTCTDQGYTIYTCTVCDNHTYTDDFVNASGHDYGTWNTEEGATCTENGTLGHYKCSVCDKYFDANKVEIADLTITAPGHTPATAVEENRVGATCTVNGSYDTVVYCEVCGEELNRETTPITAPGHTPATAVEENRVGATCTVNGSYDTVVYCEVCGEELSRETTPIIAPGHTPATAVEENRVGATCTANGSYDTVVYCEVCGEELSRETTPITAPGHDAVVYEDNADNATHKVYYPCCNAVVDAAEAHNYAYTTSGTTITATCQSCNFSASVTLNAPTGDLVYDNTAKYASVSSNIFGIDADDITYSTTDADDTTLVNAGTYTASITLGGKTVNVTYTITPATITISDATVSFNFGAEMAYGTEIEITLPNGAELDGYSYVHMKSGQTKSQIDGLGNWTVTAKIKLADSHNYVLSTDSYSKVVKVVAATTNIDNINWNAANNNIRTETYTGLSFTDLLNGQLPDHIAADIVIKLGGVEVDAINNVGVYTVSVTFRSTDTNYVPSKTALADLTFEVTKAKIDVSELTWDYSAAFPYDGTEHEIKLESVPAGLVPVYANNGTNTNKATNAGLYTASVTFTLTDECSANYEISGATPDCSWQILVCTINPGSATLSDKTVEYNAETVHKLTVEGVDLSLFDVTYVYTNTATGETYYNGVTLCGTYNVTATLTLKEEIKNSGNYKIDGDVATIEKSAVLTVSGAPAFNYEKPGYKVDVTEGLTPDYTLGGSDVTVDYEGKVYEIDGKDAEVLAAYNIEFTQLGKTVNVNDLGKTFRVSLLIPEEYRSLKDDELMVIHIADDGTVTVMEDAVRNGDYMEFDTTHFSVYAIVRVEGPSLAWLWILLIVIAIALIAVVVFFIIKRRNDEKKAPAPDEIPAISAENNEPAEEAPVEETPAEEAPAEEAVDEVVEEEPETEIPAIDEVPEVEDEAPVEAMEEPVVEEEPVEEAAPEAPKTAVLVMGEDGKDATAVIGGETVHIRFRSSFMSRLIQADEKVQMHYTILKNHILSYKGIKARGSWNYEAFNKGRVQCVKLNIKGKTLIVNLNLDPAEFNINKYHFLDMSAKPKFAKVPMMMKVRSDRALKYTVELIDEMMKKLEIPQREIPDVDYRMPYETTEELAKRGLVKVILPAGVTLSDDMTFVHVNVSELIESGTTMKTTEQIMTGDVAIATEEAPVAEAPTVEEAPVVEETATAVATEEAPAAEEAVAEEVHVDAVTADQLVTDEEAEAKIERVHTGAVVTGGKMGEINLDVICENFEDGERVDLESLKAKHLISNKIGKVKVLARGVMTKKLTVSASKFSLQAVKMITLAGGKVEIED